MQLPTSISNCENPLLWSAINGLLTTGDLIDIHHKTTHGVIRCSTVSIVAFGTTAYLVVDVTE